MPTHQIDSKAAESNKSGERSRPDNAVYFSIYKGARMAFADYTSRGAVAVITLKNPPVNALSLGLRTAIADGVDRATSDASIRAVVICGSGSAFSGGAHVGEFRFPAMPPSPSLVGLCALIANRSK